MSTLAELRGELRLLLNDDTAEGYLWSDATLNMHLDDAIREYSRSFPRQREATLATVAGQSAYDLPADCLSVARVDAVETHGRTPLLPGTGDESGSTAGAGRYEVYDGKLILLPTPTESGTSIAVRYLAPHAGLVSDADPCTVPDADEDLLLTCAGSRVLQALLTEDAKRRRFEARSGQPARAVANLYREQYERGIRLRTATIRAGRLVLP